MASAGRLNVNRLRASAAKADRAAAPLVGRASRRPTVRSLLALVIVLATGCALTPGAVAAVRSSHNIAYVYDFGAGVNDGAFTGSSVFENAITGSPPGTGTSASYTGTTPAGSAAYTFTDVPLSTLDANPSTALGGFDTALLYEVCSIGDPANAPALGAINSFLNAGGKLIILDGDRCAPGEAGVPDYSKFVLPFQSSNPGPQGASGPYTFIESSTLTAGLSLGPQPGDAVGDANILTTRDPAWFEAIGATNISGTAGPVEAYGRASGGGLALFEGEDFWFTFGASPHLKQVFDLLLGQQWDPDGLPGSKPIAGCSTTPASTAPSDVLTAELCQIIGSEGDIAGAESDVLGLANQLPNVVQATIGSWTGPLSAGISAGAVANTNGDISKEIADVKKINSIALKIATNLTGADPCLSSIIGSLDNAVLDDAAATTESAKAAKAMTYALSNPTGTTLQEINKDLGNEAKDYISKWSDLAKALIKLGSQCGNEAVNPTVFESNLNSEAASLTSDSSAVSAAEDALAPVPSGGYLIIGTQTGLTATINPIDWPLPTSQFPTAVPPTGQIIPAPLSGTLNLGGVTSIGPASSLTVSGAGYLGGGTVNLAIGSLPVRLATLTADSGGNFSTTVQIPAGISAGAHELEAIGHAPDGSTRVLGTAVTVTTRPGHTPSQTCIGTLTGTFNGGVDVPAGAPCTIEHATVNGGVSVGAGAVFEADGSTINGDVSATAGPTGFALCGDLVHGSVIVNSSSIPAVIGSAGSAICPSTTITGPTSIS